MKRCLSLFLFLILVTSFVAAEINEKALENNAKEFFIKEWLRESGITGEVTNAINTSNPKAIQDLVNTCETTGRMRFIIGLLALGGIIGLFTFPPAGIVVLLIDIAMILNNLCILTG